VFCFRFYFTVLSLKLKPNCILLITQKVQKWHSFIYIRMTRHESDINYTWIQIFKTSSANRNRRLIKCLKGLLNKLMKLVFLLTLTLRAWELGNIALQRFASFPWHLALSAQWPLGTGGVISSRALKARVFENRCKQRQHNQFAMTSKQLVFFFLISIDVVICCAAYPW